MYRLSEHNSSGTGDQLIIVGKCSVPVSLNAVASRRLAANLK